MAQMAVQQRRRGLVVGLGVLGLLGGVLLGGLAIGNWLFPLPPHAFQGSFSPVYYDRHGQLLGARLAPDDKWRFASRLEDVSPYLITALLAFEDKRFYHHVGIDLYALARATWQNLTRGRVASGASTITMQVARLLSPARRYGTLTGKLMQMWRALQLEWYLSKPEILELYFNLAPYGKNIEGVTAAAWLYFHKPPATLQWTEAMALAIAPKSPQAYRPDRFPPAAQSTASAWQNGCGGRGRYLRPIGGSWTVPARPGNCGLYRAMRPICWRACTQGPVATHGWCCKTSPRRVPAATPCVPPLTSTCSSASSRPLLATCARYAGRASSMRQCWCSRLPRGRC